VQEDHHHLLKDEEYCEDQDKILLPTPAAAAVALSPILTSSALCETNSATFSSVLCKPDILL
jgi:hypothetical protein